MSSKNKQERLDRRVQTVCLLILASISVGVALFLLRPVLVPFVLALFFTYGLSPIIDAQVQKFRMPLWLALTSTGIFGILILSMFGFLIADAAGSMLNDLEPALKRFDQATGAPIVVPTTEPTATTAPSTGIRSWFSLRSLGIMRDTERGLLQIPEQASVKFISNFLGETLTVVSSGFLVVIFMIFLLIGHNPRRERRVGGLLADIESRAKRYISLMTFLSIVIGLMTTAVLGLLGVKYAGVFGLLAFVLNFIPSIGGIIATCLPLPVILFSPEMGSVAKIFAIALPGAMQFVMGNIIQPKIQGESLELHPVVVLMALIFFGMIWGIVGAFLATPITAVIKIILERMPATRAIGQVLAGDLTVLSETLRAGKENSDEDDLERV